MKAWMGALALLIGMGTASAVQAGVLDHEYRRLAGQERVNLAQAYGGQVLLVVNTASKCGFTPQYEGLEALNAKYGPQGFAVLGFPSNDFMGQEPGSEEQIAEFCTLTYGVKFPMFAKSHVRGSDANPLHKELIALSGTTPKWNFYKYLVARDGRTVTAYSSMTSPDDKGFVQDIERLLNQAR